MPSAVVKITAPAVAIAEVDFSPVLGRTLIACCWTGTSSTGVTGVEVGPPDSPTGAAGGVSNETRFDLYTYLQTNTPHDNRFKVASRNIK